MKVFGLNTAVLAGWIFLTGNLSLLALGGWRSDWTELVAALLWVTSSECLRRSGSYPKAFPVGCGISSIAIILTNYDELRLINWPLLLSGHSPATETLIGTILFVIGNGVFGVFSKPLSLRFRHADNGAVRFTLGRPCMVRGILSAVSLLPILRDAVKAGNLPLSIIFVAYLVGEALIAISSPDHEPAPAYAKP